MNYSGYLVNPGRKTWEYLFDGETPKMAREGRRIIDVVGELIRLCHMNLKKGWVLRFEDDYQAPDILIIEPMSPTSILGVDGELKTRRVYDPDLWELIEKAHQAFNDALPNRLDKIDIPNCLEGTSQQIRDADAFAYLNRLIEVATAFRDEPSHKTLGALNVIMSDYDLLILKRVMDKESALAQTLAPHRAELELVLGK